jgi:hypothetical protein
MEMCANLAPEYSERVRAVADAADTLQDAIDDLRAFQREIQDAGFDLVGPCRFIRLPPEPGRAKNPSTTAGQFVQYAHEQGAM